MRVECKKIVVGGKFIPDIVDLNVNITPSVQFQFYRTLIKKALEIKLGKRVDNFSYKFLTFQSPVMTPENFNTLINDLIKAKELHTDIICISLDECVRHAIGTIEKMEYDEHSIILKVEGKTFIIDRDDLMELDDENKDKRLYVISTRNLSWSLTIII